MYVIFISFPVENTLLLDIKTVQPDIVNDSLFIL